MEKLSARVCELRPWRPDDVDALVPLADNRAVWRMVRDLFPHPYSRSDAQAWIEYAAVAEGELPLAITVDGRLAGGIGLAYGGDINRFSAEVGYWLGEPFWGRGIATDAVGRIVEYGFGELGMLRLFALPFTDNRRSCRVLEKTGFVREGVLRAAAFKENEVRDQAMYARINPGWRRREP